MMSLRRATFFCFFYLLLHRTTTSNAVSDSRPSEDGNSDLDNGSGGGSGSGAWENFSGSDSGSSSGSDSDQGRGGEGETGEGGDEDGAGEVTACSAVLRAGEGEVGPVTSSTAYTAVSCHLSCMEEVTNSSQFPVSAACRGVGSMWRSVFLQHNSVFII